MNKIKKVFNNRMKIINNKMMIVKNKMEILKNKKMIIQERKKIIKIIFKNKWISKQIILKIMILKKIQPNLRNPRNLE